MRWEPPLLTITRVATRDTELGGVRDPGRCDGHADAGRGQPTGRPVPGSGHLRHLPKPRAHRRAGATGSTCCLGMHLARLEMRVAINLLLDRLPNLRLDPDGGDPHIRGQVFRSPTSLPVLFDALIRGHGRDRGTAFRWAGRDRHRSRERCREEPRGMTSRPGALTWSWPITVSGWMVRVRRANPRRPSSRRSAPRADRRSRVSLPWRTRKAPGPSSTPRSTRSVGSISSLNNAGISDPDGFEALTVSQFRAMVDVHYFGSLFVTRAAWPHLSARIRPRREHRVRGDARQYPRDDQLRARERRGMGAHAQPGDRGGRFRIRVNAVAPRAFTRMSDAQSAKIAGSRRSTPEMMATT